MQELTEEMHFLVYGNLIRKCKPDVDGLNIIEEVLENLKREYNRTHA